MIAYIHQADSHGLGDLFQLGNKCIPFSHTLGDQVTRRAAEFDLPSRFQGDSGIAFFQPDDSHALQDRGPSIPLD